MYQRGPDAGFVARVVDHGMRTALVSWVVNHGLQLVVEHHVGGVLVVQREVLAPGLVFQGGRQFGLGVVLFQVDGVLADDHHVVLVVLELGVIAR